MTGKVSKLLVIADDRWFAQGLVRLIESSAQGKYSVQVCTFAMGVKSVKSEQPDLLIVDGDRYEKDKTAQYIRSLMPKFYRPLIVCTAQHYSNFGFMNAGAMDVIIKPEEDAQLFSARLFKSLERLLKAAPHEVVRQLSIPRRQQGTIIAIGGSTGSTQALPVILDSLRGEMPPIVAVLHMPENYTRIYAEQLDKTTRFDVVEARSGLYLKNNMVVIAKGGEHLRVFHDKEGYFVSSEAGVRVSGHCPSVDVLFDSAAYCAKSSVIGVILTGMGCDGAKGMLTMKTMGAFTIGQDEKSSVVYGMPRAAFENGSVKRQLSLERIADELNMKVKMMKKDGE